MDWQWLSRMEARNHRGNLPGSFLIFSSHHALGATTDTPSMEGDSLLPPTAGSLWMKTCASEKRFKVFVSMENLAIWIGFPCFLSSSFCLQTLKLQFSGYQILRKGCVLKSSSVCRLFRDFLPCCQNLMRGINYVAVPSHWYPCPLHPNQLRKLLVVRFREKLLVFFLHCVQSVKFHR